MREPPYSPAAGDRIRAIGNVFAEILAASMCETGAVIRPLNRGGSRLTGRVVLCPDGLLSSSPKSWPRQSEKCVQ